MAMTTNGSDLVTWLAGCFGGGGADLLSCEDLEELASHLSEEHHAGGTSIYERDSLPDRVRILRSGSVELTRDLGGKSSVIQILQPGSVFGDVPLFLRTGVPTEARAIVDSVVLSIDSVTLFGLLGRRPMLARRWLVSIAGRVAELQDRVSDLLVGGLDRQVASWLLRETKSDGYVAVSQLTLARLLGARRTSVNQSLRRLEADGVIETGYRRITVTDPIGLAALLRRPQGPEM
jgi:CRP-like cAMP-binding protein